MLFANSQIVAAHNAEYPFNGIRESRDKDSSLESTNPGFRDSSLTSPMTTLML